LEFYSDSIDKKTTILAGATANYIDDKCGGDLEKWKSLVIQNWQGKGDIIFNQKIHRDPYFNSLEGELKILGFLNEVQE
jgi:hypothetical protein